MDDKEKRLRKAIDDLHHYTENPRNPLISPDFSKLLEEVCLARDAMIAEAEETSNEEISTL